MPRTAGRNLFLRQAEWGSDCCLLEQEPWNTYVASANKRSDTEIEQFLYNCHFRLCVASGLTHRSFLNGVKLPTVGKVVTREKATAVSLGVCSRILWLWLPISQNTVLPISTRCPSEANFFHISTFQLFVYNVYTRVFHFQVNTVGDS